MALSAAYRSTLGGTIDEAVGKAERNSLKLVESSLNLPENKLELDGGAGLKYDERNLPEPAASTEY